MCLVCLNYMLMPIFSEFRDKNAVKIACCYLSCLIALTMVLMYYIGFLLPRRYIIRT